jgi:hypothetical protein
MAKDDSGRQSTQYKEQGPIHTDRDTLPSPEPDFKGVILPLIRFLHPRCSVPILELESYCSW